MENIFYIDKTHFIRNGGKPREYEYAGEIFFCSIYWTGGFIREFVIWEDEKYRNLQGTYPVISLSFANVKRNNLSDNRSER